MTARAGRKSFFHAAGIVEGTETIIAFVLFCLFPAAFPWLAGIFAGLCFWTAAAARPTKPKGNIFNYL